MSSNLFTPKLRYTNKDTCNSAWTFIDGQNVSDIEVPQFIKNLFTSFDDSRYGKMGKDLIEGVDCSTIECGTNASCNEGGSGDGYTCTCDAGFYGSDTTRAPASCVACTPVTNASTVTCTDGNNSSATCNDGFHRTENSVSGQSDTCNQCTAQTGCETSGTTCSTAAGHETELICLTAGTGYSINEDVAGLVVADGDGITSNTCTLEVCNDSNVLKSPPPTLAADETAADGNCCESPTTTHTCASAFDGATTGISQPCNLNAPDSAGWTKGDFDDDPLWGKYDTGEDNSSLTDEQATAIEALISANSSMNDSGNPTQMDTGVWGKCCKKADCYDDGWDTISITGSTGSWIAWSESLGC